MEAKHWIEVLQLKRHPEGGFFRETYRSAATLPAAVLPDHGGPRSVSTAIYYLLDGNDFSALHRIRSDEILHFYDGTGLTISVIAPDGSFSEIRLGRDAEAGEVPQAVVSAGCLFGARLINPRSYALIGCTVAPGFDFADFEIPGRQELLRLYPQHKAVIEVLTR